MPSTTYELISTGTVATTGGTLAFTSIPQTYKDLILKYKVSYNYADGYRSYAYVSMSGSSTANHVRCLIFAVDANTPNFSASNGTQTGTTYLSGFTGAVDDASNNFGTGELVILNYASSLAKATLYESGHFSTTSTGTNAIGFGGTQTIATTAITTLTLGGGADFGLGLTAGSTASLYGLKSS